MATAAAVEVAGDGEVVISPEIPPVAPSAPFFSLFPFPFL
jgi:hypothetical protein